MFRAAFGAWGNVRIGMYSAERIKRSPLTCRRAFFPLAYGEHQVRSHDFFVSLFHRFVHWVFADSDLRQFDQTLDFPGELWRSAGLQVSVLVGDQRSDGV